MKRLFLLSFLLITSHFLTAQMFDVDTLQFSGPIDQRINFVILGDGYMESELDKFVADATDYTNEFFSQTPFKEYQDYFNVFIIKVPSNESGASHPGTATDVTEPAHPVLNNVDNFFGSTFDAFGIHRLLVAENFAAINNVLAGNFPLYDQVLILTNSPFYGGSGGTFAVSSTEESANEIAIHEIGHSFSALADEYYAGDNFATERINMTQVTDPTTVKWSNWHGDNGIGIYQHCCSGNSAQWYRPHENCKMRFLGFPFCAVCVEGIIEEIHTLVSPVNGFSPGVTIDNPTFPLKLKLDLIHPNPNTLMTNWLLNGDEFVNNVDSISINMEDLVAGTNEIEVVIEDTTNLQRIDNHGDFHVYFVLWTIENTMTNLLQISSSLNEIEIEVFPNPTTDFVTVKLESTKEVDIEIEVITLDGKNLNSISTNHADQVDIDLSQYNQGTYILNFKLGNHSIGKKKIMVH